MERYGIRVADGKDPKAARNVVSNFCFISELPVFITHEIFFRLPIKAIMRCKCVCTAWHNLLSKPNFSSYYVKNSNFTRLLYYSDKSSRLDLYLLEISENGDCSQTPIDLKLPACLKEKSYFSLKGSCNGFLCLLVKRTSGFDEMENEKSAVEIVCVTNPIVGDSITLPEYERYGKVGDDWHKVKYHFGFSPLANKFKVLRTVFKLTLLPDSYVSKMQECNIFTVGVDDNWRTLSFPFPGLQFWSKVIAFNGSFYWIPWDGHRCLDMIPTFDLAEEKVGQISIPSDLILHHRKTELRVVDDHLSLIDHSDKSHITIWTMKKYGTAECWSKKVILQRSWFPSEAQQGYCSPIAEPQEGKMIFSCSNLKGLICCNIKEKKCSEIGIYADEMAWPRDHIMPYAPNFFHGAEML